VLNTPTERWDDGPSLLASLWRYRWLVVAAVLLGGLVGYGLSIRQPRQYEATARLLLSTPGENALPGVSAPAIDSDRYLRNQAQFINSSPVVSRAAEIARRPAGAWRGSLVVQPAKDLDLIVVRVRASTGKDAAKLANSVVEAYQEVRAKRTREGYLATQARVKATTDKLRAKLADLNAKLQTDGTGDPYLTAQQEAAEGQLKAIVAQGLQASTAGSLTDSTIQLSEKATPPAQPVEPHPKRTAAAGAVFGLFAVSALTWLLNRQRLQPPQPSPSDSEEARLYRRALIDLPGENAPVLGAVPDFAGAGGEGLVPTVTAPESAAAESYRTIAQRLEFAAREGGFRTLLVTSPEAGDGKTVTILNLGITAGQDGRSMVAVDADLRHRDLSELCHINGRAGLSDMVNGASGMTTGQYVWLVEFPGIQVIPGGSLVRDASSVFTAPTFGAVMSTIREHGDLILIDSPALTEGPDALAIAKQVDAAVLVVNPRTPLGVLQETRRLLDSAGVPVLGYVVNGEVSRSQAKRQGNGASATREHGLRRAMDAVFKGDSAS
jgi:Mrp family chromosome partitioning ATPase/capsular polysaccharide biosynthesis protein